MPSETNITVFPANTVEEQLIPGRIRWLNGTLQQKFTVIKAIRKPDGYVLASSQIYEEWRDVPEETTS